MQGKCCMMTPDLNPSKTRAARSLFPRPALGVWAWNFHEAFKRVQRGQTAPGPKLHRRGMHGGVCIGPRG
jgi:hypothetical protein